MRRPKITVIGSSNVDLVTYIDRMPREGETIVAPRFEMGFGGKGANQAVAAALLGARVAMVSKVGDDLFGPSTRKNYEGYGIDATFVESVAGVSSGVAPIFVDRNAKNSILIIKGANDRLAPADVDRARDLVLSSDLVILQLEIPLETVYRAIELCAEGKVPVILNPAPADPRLDIGRLRSVEYFAPNETELQTLTGMPTGDMDEVKAAARSLLAKGIRNVLVTLGDKGCLLLSGDTEIRVPVHTVKSVDTTGAGDAFIGCFATYLVETGDVERAMVTAGKYAAFSTMKPGTQKSFLDRAAFEALLAGCR